MSKAALFLFDRKFNIYNLNLSFQKPYDQDLSFPIHNTVGSIRFVLNPYKTSDIISTALSNNQIIDGEIHVYDRFGHQKLRKIEFYNAYVVRFVENYDLECNPSLINTVTLYPGIININNASKHKTPWNDWLHGDKDSSKNKAPIAAPIPTISPIQWIDADSGKQISEIRYGQQVSLRTRIDHAEDNTATITIHKKDGTAFESGKSQLSFTEEITNDGKITLDSFEIKSLWEETGDDKSVSLIAEIDHCGIKKSSGELNLMPTPFDEQLKIIDADGSPQIDLVYCIIKRNEIIANGKTDQNGYIQRLKELPNQEEYIFLWGDEALAKLKS